MTPLQMNKIVVDWQFPKALVIVWCVAIFYCVVAWLYVHDNTKQMSALAALFFGLVTLSTYFIAQQPKTTEIDIQNGIVIKRYRSVLWMSKTRLYSLKSFRSVRSYFTTGRNYTNVVELVALGGKEAIQIARFSPVTTIESGTLGTRKFYRSGRCDTIAEEDFKGLFSRE